MICRIVVNNLLENLVRCWMSGWWLKKLAGRMDGWMDGWMEGRESRVKDCLQQSKIINSISPNVFNIISEHTSSCFRLFKNLNIIQ